MNATIYWHDYETWGADTLRDRPAQFAGIRTDLDLNIIGEPLEIYCALANDYLPHPMACLVTGLTPQKVNRLGIPETEFITRINQAFSQPGTTVAGYNSIRFDDEITRHSLYRNFQDPYAREWQQGNSRWDIIDLVRACYALRPEGINWPMREDATPSFRLEHLTAANGISHEGAHDALSDVTATIAMAKLIKEKQPKLFKFLFDMRRKQEVAKHLDLLNMTPLVHVSSKLAASQGCCSYIAPIAYHPENKNGVICVNLNMDLTPLLELTPAEIAKRMYTRKSELGDLAPVALKVIHINKCPVIAPAKTLTPARADELGIDRQLCRKNLDLLKTVAGLREKIEQVYQQPRELSPITDPDLMLYSGGFFSQHDKTQMEMIRATPPEALSGLQLQFDDPRLPEMLFRYRARNFPLTLSDQELRRWDNYRRDKLDGGEFAIEMENLVEEHHQDEKKIAILKALYQYVSTL